MTMVQTQQLTLPRLKITQNERIPIVKHIIKDEELGPSDEVLDNFL